MRCLLVALFCCAVLSAAEEGVAPSAVTSAPVLAPTSTPPATAEVPAPIFATVTIANKLARLTLSTQRGAVVRFELLDEHPVRLPKPLERRLGDRPSAATDQPLALLDNFHHFTDRTILNLHNVVMLGGDGSVVLDGTERQPWTVADRGDDHVAFLCSLPERGIDLRLEYRMEVERPAVISRLTIRNLKAEPLPVAPRLDPAIGGIHQDYALGESYYLCAATHRGGANGKIETTTPPKPGSPVKLGTEPFDYVTLKSRFFAALWQSVEATPAPAAVTPEAPASGGLSSAVVSAATAVPANGVSASTFSVKRGEVQQLALRIDFAKVELAPGAEHTWAWRLTGTSMRKEALERLQPDEARVRYTDAFYRFFKSLAGLLEWCLTAIHLVVGNYGVAVIVLTIALKALLHRFTFKQQSSMLKMQKLAPEMKLLQERHKNDRQALGTKTMELYRKHGVNPLSGCLPMFIQIPMFMALYQAFSHSADLRGEAFLWASDLTLEDALWGVDHAWFRWLTINPLALIYIAVMVWMGFQTTIPEGADDQQKQMAKMMRWMPILFGVFFYHMPAGLVLYFCVNAILSTIEIRWIKKRIGMT